MSFRRGFRFGAGVLIWDILSKSKCVAIKVFRQNDVIAIRRLDVVEHLGIG